MRKVDRHKFILDAIASTPVSSQKELARILHEGGFDVTQASVSRDLEELGVVKVDRLYRRLERSADAHRHGLLAVENSGGNLVVAKCTAGLASAVAVRIDAAHIPEIIGTLAGDDTIFIAVKDAKAQRAAVKKIWEIFRDR